MPVTCTAPIATSLAADPWQQLPEMAHDYRAECAGIEAGILLLEAYHIHCAEQRFEAGDVPGGIDRMHAALDATRLRVDIVGVMK